MTNADFDAEYAEQQLALRDTITWDDIYARACRRASDSGFAQLILQRGPARYTLVDGSTPDALKIARLRGAKVHVILDWKAQVWIVGDTAVSMFACPACWFARVDGATPAPAPLRSHWR